MLATDVFGIVVMVIVGLIIIALLILVGSVIFNVAADFIDPLREIEANRERQYQDDLKALKLLQHHGYYTNVAPDDVSIFYLYD